MTVGRESSQRKKWHVRYSVLRQAIDEGVVVAVGHVVEVLHTRDICNFLRLGELLWNDAVPTEQPMVVCMHALGWSVVQARYRRGVSEPDA